MIWKSFKPIVWIALIAAVVLLALAGMVSQCWTKIITPEPENAAEGLVTALGAHRYSGAINQLSQDLKQQVTPADLQSLVERIERSQARGIYDAHGQDSQEQGDEATATVEVELDTNEKVNIELPLVKENGLWRVSSLEGLERLIK